MFLKNLWKIWQSPVPFHQGYLPKADGHEVWYAAYGNPQGIPILTTHGGPGGYCRPERAKLFDLSKYRIIMFDQRGCGNSKPFGELKHNTTNDLLFDMERLLNHLKIDGKIILHGGSWASTLMLLFAEHHPSKVRKLLLSQIFLADEQSEKWEQEQCGLFYPDMLAQLKAPLKDWQTIPEYYYKQLTSDNIMQQKKALETYGCFERVLGNLNPHWRHIDDVDNKDLGYTRIYAQYALAHYYIKNNEIMRQLKKIKHIPTLIVHNRLDMLCPLQGAYELSQKLEKCKLVISPEKGHVGKVLHKTIRREISGFLKYDN